MADGRRSLDTHAAVCLLAPAIADHAAAADRDVAFPGVDVTALQEAGAFRAPLPRRLGGEGAGTEPTGAALLRDLLRTLGQASLPVARVFEAHVNAIALVFRDGTQFQCETVAGDVRAGHLFGLWVTDPPGGGGLRWDGTTLAGAKGPCSGAGHCSRALVTVETDDGTRMAIVALDGREPVSPITGLTGMRAARNGIVRLDGRVPLFWLGRPSGYLDEPAFSGGAWRASAAALGGLDSLVAAVAAGLRARGREHAPLQLARFGRLVLAHETAAMWVERAMQTAEEDGEVAVRMATVGLARLAVESACLDAIRHTQQALGLSAFSAPNPAERIMRDLATYLRQPAGDEILLEAASVRLQRA